MEDVPYFRYTDGWGIALYFRGVDNKRVVDCKTKNSNLEKEDIP